LRYFCLISDYDGTLAHNGQVSANTLLALKRVKASGRKLVLATGRELPELLRVFLRHLFSIWRSLKMERCFTIRPPAKNVCWLNRHRLLSSQNSGVGA